MLKFIIHKKNVALLIHIYRYTLPYTVFLASAVSSTRGKLLPVIWFRSLLVNCSAVSHCVLAFYRGRQRQSKGGYNAPPLIIWEAIEFRFLASEHRASLLFSYYLHKYLCSSGAVPCLFVINQVFLFSSEFDPVADRIAQCKRGL